MTKHLLLHLIVFSSAFVVAQKQSIDVDLLSNIISAKQDELKTRVLSNIVVKNIETTNYTTYNAIYNLVDIITTEKNKTVMTQSIIRQIADYSLVMGLTSYYLKNKVLQDSTNKLIILKTSTTYLRDSNQNKYITTGIAEIMKSTYDYETKNGEQSQTEINLKKGEELQWNMLLANFLIDTAYQVLSNDSGLVQRGFFKKDPQRQFFRSGLGIDTTGVIDHFTQSENNIITDFVSFLDSCTKISDTANRIIDFVTDPAIQFNNFGKNSKGDFNLTKEDIGLLMFLFDEAISTFRDQIGQNNFIATIGDIIARYVIFDFSEDDREKVYDFKIDVEAIILAFEDKFYENGRSSVQNHFIGIRPFFTIGLNYGYFLNQNNTFNFDNTPKNLTQIALAGEKIGCKFIFSDFKYTRSHPPMEWYKYRGNYQQWLTPVAKPLVNNIYGIIYGSGILYNIVDIKSESNFNYAIAGASLGVEFFNGLEFNLGYAMPIIPKENIGQMADKGFVNIGFDIPIFEYIKSARDKNK